MYVCVCKQKNEIDFIELFNKGKSIKDAIRHFDCTQCKLCKPFIWDLYENHKSRENYCPLDRDRCWKEFY